MANNRNIDIKITQRIDEASVKRTAEKVKNSATKAAEAITKVEEEESQKRIAIAEAEAELKRRTLESTNSSPASTDTVRRSNRVETVSAWLLRRREAEQKEVAKTTALLEELARLREGASEDIQLLEEWTGSIGDQCAALEEVTTSTGFLTKAFESQSYQYGALAARGEDVKVVLGRIANSAGTLEERLRKGTISQADAARALEKIKGVSHACGRQTETLSAEMETLGNKMRATASLSQRYAAAQQEAAAKTATLGKTATRVTGGMEKGFRAAGKAVTTVTRALGRITFVMATISMAWEGLSKLWDWVKGKSDAAIKAEEEHAEAVKKLQEQEQDYLDKLQESSQKLLVEKTWEWQERGIKAVNKVLKEEIELQQQAFDLALKKEELEMDEAELELNRQERILAEQEAKSLISEQEADSERTAIALRRAELQYRRVGESNATKRQGVEAERKELQAGVNTAQAGIDKLQPLLEATDKFADITRRITSQEEMQQRRSRAQVEGEVSAQEFADFEESNAYVKSLLQEAGLAGLYESYTKGLIDLPTELRKHKEKLTEELNAFTLAVKKKNNELEDLELSDRKNALDYGDSREEIESEAVVRKEKRERQKRKEELDKEAEAAEARAEASEQKAREASKSLLHKNKLAIDTRLHGHEGEKGVAELYDKISSRGDAAMLKKVLAELGRDGRQAARKGWSSEQLQMYNIDNVKEMTALRGRDREFWQTQFQGLLQSMRLEGQAEKLDEASEKMKEAAREHQQSLHKIGEGVDAMATTYTEFVEEIKRLEASVKRSLQQARYARNAGR